MCELGPPLYVPTSCGMRRVGRTVGASVDSIIRPWCRSFSLPSQPLRPHTTVLHLRREGERDHSPTRGGGGRGCARAFHRWGANGGGYKTRGSSCLVRALTTLSK